MLKSPRTLGSVGLLGHSGSGRRWSFMAATSSSYMIGQLARTVPGSLWQPYTTNGVLNQIPNNPTDPNVLGLLSMNSLAERRSPGAWFYNAAPIQPTKWREELFRIDHNVTDKVRASFRYIHDSWDTLNPTPLWTNIGSFPTVQTNFKGPGISMVARLTATISPTCGSTSLSPATRPITYILNNVGAVKGPSGAAYKNLFNNNTTDVLPGINLVGGKLL